MRPLIATPTVGAKVQQIGNESHEDSDLNDESRCRTEGCEENPSGGEGWAGWCGNCADRRYAAGLYDHG